MRWRYLKLDFPYLIGELIIVVLGVLIALAANGWYEGRQERRVEQDYLARILVDLEIGAGQLTDHGIRNEMSMEATSGFIAMLESGIDDEQVFLGYYLYAAQVGGTAADFQHDVTYRELVSTGNLNIIADENLRTNLTQYYRGVDDLISIRSIASDDAYLPVARQIGLTGKFPEQFTLRDADKTNDIPFIAPEAQRILEDIADNREAIERASRRQLGFQRLQVPRYDFLIKANAELRAMLELAQ